MGTRLKTVFVLSPVATIPSCTDNRESIHLQFRPTPGERQTMRVSSRWTMSHPTRYGPDCKDSL